MGTSPERTTATTSPAGSGDLSSRLRLAITRMARRMRQEAGTDLSPSLTSALATIERHGPLTPSKLATLERIQRPSATRIVARLESEGLVDRAADPADGRASLVSASRQGRVLLRRLRGRKNAYLARRMRDLPDEDLEALRRAAEVLERLLEGERS